MATLYYEHGEPQTAYRIDEVYQHLLVYISAYGSATLQDIVDSVKATQTKCCKPGLSIILDPMLPILLSSLQRLSR